jgi:methionyl-tRNA synthetase
MSDAKPFLITTAIDYPNGKPHMGHAYEKIVTDTYARWHRLRGEKVYFLTGTDENGQKLVKAAQEAGVKTQAFVDSNAELFKKLCGDLSISYDDFIRTTETRHIKTAQSLWKKIEAAGDIYFDAYEGQYCLACEAFYTETQAPDKICPSHGTGLEAVKEEGFFFRLSKHIPFVRDLIQNQPHFIRPESARNEMLKRIDAEAVRDLSVSRPNQGWGIAVPGNEAYVMYTWFDALINYIAPFYGTPDEQKFWPAGLHVIGKDITWFHTVIWPAMLHSTGLPVPKQVYVHGMVLGSDGRKMSKSLGNGVDPQEITDKYPLESFRYYLLRAIPSGGDGAFVTEDMIKRHNSELANDFGNLLMRVVKFWIKKCGTEFSFEGIAPPSFDYQQLMKVMDEQMVNREHNRALESLWVEITKANTYFSDSTPWKLEANDPRFAEIMGHSLYSIRAFAYLLQAFMPQTSKTVLECLGIEAPWTQELLSWGGKALHLAEPQVLFQKIEMS